MTEVWLRSNRRVILMALLPVSLFGGLSFSVLTWEITPLVRSLASGCFVVFLGLLMGLGQQFFRPRIAYRNGHVLFNLLQIPTPIYMRPQSPITVPVEVVEAFFLGQGPAYLTAKDAGKAETVNLVARLSQRATEWAQQDVEPALGRWCDGYVTIRGTWCEPLTGELIRQLNHRLSEVSRLSEEDESETKQ